MNTYARYLKYITAGNCLFFFLKYLSNQRHDILNFYSGEKKELKLGQLGIKKQKKWQIFKQMFGGNLLICSHLFLIIF